MAFFDHKAFNSEVFQRYMDSLPNPVLDALINSGAVRQRNDLAAVMSDQVGGNYITTPLTGNIGGEAQNYDGTTDLKSDTTRTFMHSRVVVGRMKAWEEKDFSHDITGGKDFMEVVAGQVNKYWDEIDQATIIHMLAGVFGMQEEKGLAWAAQHTFNACNLTEKDGAPGHLGATTLNTAMQRACGDNKSRFSLAIMHSAVSTNLENLRVLEHLKYTDQNGMTRDTALATYNGRAVLVDDGMPTFESESVAEVKGVYTLTVSTQGVAGDKVTIGGVQYTFGDATNTAKKTLAVGESADNQATAIKTVLSSQYAGIFKVTVAAAVVTLTQLIGGVGEKPSVEVSGTVKVDVAQTTEGVARQTQTTYVTYVLGEGVIEYTDCGAKVPSEMFRDPNSSGGKDELITRQRKAFAPFGISFTKKHMTTLSPTDAELENGENWELVHSDSEGGTEYISGKVIPIARILSLG